jgi:hypothetical protein
VVLAHFSRGGSPWGPSPGHEASESGSPIGAAHIERMARSFHQVAFPQIREDLWSGAGSNRRPSAFQVNRAERCADLLFVA